MGTFLIVMVVLFTMLIIWLLKFREKLNVNRYFSALDFPVADQLSKLWKGVNKLNLEKVKMIIFVTSFVMVGVMSYFVSYKIGILYLVILTIMYSIILLISEGLAKNNILWTRPEEGFAIPIFIGDKFYKFVMTFRDKIFAIDDKEIYATPGMAKEEIVKINKKREEFNLSRYRTGDNTKEEEELQKLNDDWDVVDDVRKVVEKREEWIPKLLHGIRWVGLPPRRVYVYRFIWISIEDDVDDRGRVRKKLESREEYIHYIILKDDIYIISVDKAESKDMIPLDFTIAFTVRNTNPYKSLFKGERWFELLSTQSAAKIRLFTGSKGYEDIIHILKEEEDGGIEDGENKITGEELLLSNRNLGGIITDLKENYGTWAIKAQILDVNPPEEFIEAATKAYVAQKQADADAIQGQGWAKRDGKWLESISKTDGWLQLLSLRELSKLTGVLSLGNGDLVNSILVKDVTKKNTDHKQEEGGETK